MHSEGRVKAPLKGYRMIITEKQMVDEGSLKNT
jgi:hypothetical protein